MNQYKVGEFIRKKRLEKNLSQEQLADELNVNNKTISRWECGTYLPPVDKLYELAAFFDISVDELLHGEEKPKDEKNESRDFRADERAIQEYKKNNLLNFCHIMKGFLFGFSFVVSLLSSLTWPDYFALFTFLSLLLFSLLLFVRKAIHNPVAQSIYSFTDYLLIMIAPILFSWMHVSQTIGYYSAIWLILSSLCLTVFLVLIFVLELIRLNCLFDFTLKLKKNLKHDSLVHNNKTKVISLMVAGAISLVCCVCFTLLNVGFCNNYLLFSFSTNTMETFIKQTKNADEKDFYISYYGEEYSHGAMFAEKDRAVVSALEVTNFTDLGNTFPYKTDSQYSEAERGSSVLTLDCSNQRLMIFCDSLIGSLSQTQNFSGSGYGFSSLRYYSLSQEDMTHLKSTVLSLSLREEN